MTIQQLPSSHDSARSDAAYVTDMVDIVLFGENIYQVVESGITLGFVHDRGNGYAGFVGEGFSNIRQICTSYSFDFCVARIADSTKAELGKRFDLVSPR